MAGGREDASTTWDRVEISEDFGASFTDLKELPEKLAYACLVIADETIFVAGGQKGKNKYCISHHLVSTVSYDDVRTGREGVSSTEGSNQGFSHLFSWSIDYSKGFIQN